MSEHYDSDVTVETADLNFDGVAESVLTDVDGDLVADSIASDLDGDGIADIEQVDTDGDGWADVIFVDAGTDGVADVAIVDSDYDTHADTVVGLTDGVEPDEVGEPDTADERDPATGAHDSLYGAYTVDESATAAEVDYTPELSSGTQAVLDMVNGQMSDAGTIYRDAMDPGSESAEDVAAANERIDNAAQNSRAMEGYIYQQEIANDIRASELDRHAVDEAREAATDAWIESERAISRANDAL